MATHLGQLNYQKTEVCVGDLLAAIFGDQSIKGFANETQISKTAHRHLNTNLPSHLIMYAS